MLIWYKLKWHKRQNSITSQQTQDKFSRRQQGQAQRCVSHDTVLLLGWCLCGDGFGATFGWEPGCKGCTEDITGS